MTRWGRVKAWPDLTAVASLHYAGSDLRRCISLAVSGPRSVAMVVSLAALASGLCLASVGACHRAYPYERSVPGDAVDVVGRLAELTPPQQAFVDQLKATADAAPDDPQAQKAAGLALMWLTLSGALKLRDAAEFYLERAFVLRDDPELQRVLGRFYNLRAVEYDFSKAGQQAEVYDALLGTSAPEQMSVEQFVAHSFRMLARIIQAADQRRMLQALKLLRQLERELEAKSAAHPDDIELHALAGNFELFFAGFVPTGPRRRMKTAVRHFEIVRERWTQLRPGIRDALHCPNTRENFMFELAEAQLALGRDGDAATIYTELATITGRQTRGKELIAVVSQHRLDHLSEYSRDLDLMPPWPSDGGNCVVCHSWTGDLPIKSLHTHEPLRLLDTPTRAESNPMSLTALTGMPQGAAPETDSP